MKIKFLFIPYSATLIVLLPLQSAPDEIFPTICTIQRDLIRRSVRPERQTVFTAEEIKMLAVLYVAIKVRVATQGVVLSYGVELRSGDNVGHTYSCGASNNLSVNL